MFVNVSLQSARELDKKCWIKVDHWFEPSAGRMCGELNSTANAGGTALGQGIAVIADWATADGAVVAGVAASVGAADRLGRGARAWVHTLVAVAGLVRRTVVVIDALATATGDEGISEETSAAEANGSVAATAVGAGFAVSVITAGVRVAQVALIERSALVERMTSESFRAAADGLVVLDAAFGAGAAGSDARIDAFKVEAGLVGAALIVLRALGIAARERIAQKVGRTRTDGTMIRDAALGIGSTGSAWVLAAEADAGTV